MPRAISSCSSVLASGVSMSARTLEPIPHDARTRLTKLFCTASGATDAPWAKVEYSTSFSTRSWYSAA